MHPASGPLSSPSTESFGASLKSPAPADETRAIIEAIPDLVIRMDARGNVLELRAGLGERTDGGSARAELLATHVTSAFSAAAARVISSQAMTVIEYPVEQAGITRHFEARMAPALGKQAVAFVRDITARKKAEEELFASREMLRSILDTIPQRVFWKDANSVYLGCNRPFAQDAGVADPKELIGKSDFATDSSEMAELYRADDREVIRTDKPKLNYEEPQERGDGARRWLRTSKVPMHDKYGRVVGVLGTYEDVTERKLSDTLRTGQNRLLEMIVAGAPLEETLNRLVQLMESLSPGMHCTILLVDADGRRLRSFIAPSLPPEFARMVDGLAIGEAQGSCGTAAARRTDVMVTDVRGDPLWENFADFAEQFGIRACWSTPIISSGETLLGTFAMYFKQPRTPQNEERQLIHVAGHLAGIAIQRKQIEDALRQAEEKYRNIFENALDGIFQISPDGRVLVANPAFARMFGYDSPAALMAAVRDVGSQLCLEPARYAEFTQALKAKGIVQRWEMPMGRPGTSPLWVSLNARVACAADGQTLCYEGIAKDITQRKRLEQQFLQAQKMEAFGQLAGGVAHDFNNLLTVILGNLSLIKLGDLPPAQRQTSFDDCLRAAERAAHLTGQLLTFSRRQHLETNDVDLNEVVSHLATMLRRLIGEHITLETQPAPEPARVRVDRAMIEQALMNLAVNSRDAMPSGGNLTLKLSLVDLDAAAVATSPRGRPGSFVRLTVSDTGAGIAPEHLPHIFEPFFTTKPVGRGTGLGLATVFGIVEQHEGWIDVESTVGVGTTMSIYVPRIRKGATAFPIPRATEPPRTGSESVLVVEDEADVRALMAKGLERHGYRVQAVSNGPEALAAWRQSRAAFDLLVTDLVMPGGMNGRDLAADLLREKPGLRVIYCTGYTEDVPGAGGEIRRTDNFLEKPFDVPVFLERVRAELDKAI
jgi:two-component system, cell cycle sensor histidine kinase and response regulator CckA